MFRLEAERVVELLLVEAAQLAGDNSSAQPVDGVGVIPASIHIEARCRSQTRGNVIAHHQSREELPAARMYALCGGEGGGHRRTADVSGTALAILVLGLDGLEIVGSHGEAVHHGSLRSAHKLAAKKRRALRRCSIAFEQVEQIVATRRVHPGSYDAHRVEHTGLDSPDGEIVEYRVVCGRDVRANFVGHVHGTPFSMVSGRLRAWFPSRSKPPGPLTPWWSKASNGSCRPFS